MNVRDFLFNFVSPAAKICIQKVVNDQILFYGRAAEIDRLEILNRTVESVSFDTNAECLVITVRVITVRNIATGCIYHLPEDLDYIY